MDCCVVIPTDDSGSGRRPHESEAWPGRAHEPTRPGRLGREAGILTGPKTTRTETTYWSKPLANRRRFPGFGACARKGSPCARLTKSLNGRGFKPQAATRWLHSSVVQILVRAA